jgi:ribosomal protein S5
VRRRIVLGDMEGRVSEGVGRITERAVAAEKR